MRISSKKGCDLVGINLGSIHEVNKVEQNKSVRTNGIFT